MSSDGQSGDQAIGGMLPPGQGRHLQAGPTRPTVKVGPHVGSRLIGMLESELPPGGGFPGRRTETWPFTQMRTMRRTIRRTSTTVLPAITTVSPPLNCSSEPLGIVRYE